MVHFLARFPLYFYTRQNDAFFICTKHLLQIFLKMGKNKKTFMYKYCAKTSQLWNVQKLNTQNDVNNIAGQSKSRLYDDKVANQISLHRTTVTLQVDLVVFHVEGDTMRTRSEFEKLCLILIKFILELRFRPHPLSFFTCSFISRFYSSSCKR